MRAERPDAGRPQLNTERGAQQHIPAERTPDTSRREGQTAGPGGFRGGTQFRAVDTALQRGGLPLERARCWMHRDATAERATRTCRVCGRAAQVDVFEM